eukprot:scaffold72135_cov22-Tisochrysis_lutea.AAC.1
MSFSLECSTLWNFSHVFPEVQQAFGAKEMQAAYKNTVKDKLGSCTGALHAPSYWVWTSPLTPRRQYLCRATPAHLLLSNMHLTSRVKHSTHA